MSSFLPSSVPAPPASDPAQNAAFSGFNAQIPQVQSYANIAQNFTPTATDTFGQGYNNPFAGQALFGAQQGAAYGQPVGMDQFGTGQYFTGAGSSLPGIAGGIPGSAYTQMGYGQNLGPQFGNMAAGAGASLFPYAGQIMNTGFDPQQALYARTAQQVQDQTRAAEAARGVASTPYGAGIEGQQMSNFNIDWQNQQLQRQAAAAQAASGLTGTGIGGLGTGASIYGTGGGLAQGGAGMLNTLANIYGTGAATAGQGLGFESAAPGTFASTSQLPYATYQGINQGQWQQLQNLLGTLGGMQNLSQTGMQDYLNLYGQGNQQQANLANIYGTQVKAAQNTFGDLAQVGSGLGSLASKIPWSSIGTMIA
jgi:hypothetical protein